MLILALLLAMPFHSVGSEELDPEPGRWHAELTSPGGPLPFGLDIQRTEAGLETWIVNGSERIPIPISSTKSGVLTLDLPHYQSRIEAVLTADGRSLSGTWQKVGAGTQRTQMSFNAKWGDAPRFAHGGEDASSAKSLAARWLVRFSSSATPAVGLFTARADGTAHGTFLTSLGDYRYLEGSFRKERLQLSCFDGAHAFLFDAKLTQEGHLAGDFWSRDTWHETWTAEPDAEATLPDPFGISNWKDSVSLDELSFFNPSTGKDASLGDKEFAGSVRLIQLFGTWCPNCHDEAPFLAELWGTYHKQGLQIVGLAFEHSGDQTQDSKQVTRFCEKHAIPFPVLLGGTSDKAEATKSFRGLDRVIAYPTVLFVDSVGRVRYVHTGFTGPAAGALHEREKERFHELIRELLVEASSAKR